MADFCNDYGDNPACQGKADPRYTEDFTDIEPGAFIYWCAYCGPIAHAIGAELSEMCATRPGFKEAFAAAIEKAEAGRVKQ